MNEVVNKFLLTGNKSISEMRLKEPGFTTVLVVHSQKAKKKIENSCKQETGSISIETIWIKPVFRTIGLWQT